MQQQINFEIFDEFKLELLKLLQIQISKLEDLDNGDLEKN